MLSRVILTSGTMDDTYDLLARALAAGGPQSGFDFLAQKFREEKNYPLLFEARLLARRHELGLPLIQTGTLEDVPEALRPVYERAFIETAREVGGLFLADGDIARAWPYYRAIGETAPVAAAIEAVNPPKDSEPREDFDAVVAIAWQERVHPRKGFELILSHYGTCRAITSFEQYPASTGRDECLHLLVRTLYRELGESLRHAIARQEGEASATASVAELMEGRDWLFEGNAYYVDSSHLISVLRFSLDLEDEPTLRLAIELAEYGKRLSPMFEFRVDPPFENVYIDHCVFLRALVGEDVDAAVAHFRAKVEASNPEEVGTAPAQVLVTLLVRLERYEEAIDVSLRYLSDIPAAQLGCPTALQLCQMAGNWERLRQVARGQGDLVSFTAALLSNA